MPGDESRSDAAVVWRATLCSAAWRQVIDVRVWRDGGDFMASGEWLFGRRVDGSTVVLWRAAAAPSAVLRVADAVARAEPGWFVSGLTPPGEETHQETVERLTAERDEALERLTPDKNTESFYRQALAGYCEVIRGRNAAPTDEEIESHEATGGRWRCLVPEASRMNADAMPGLVAMLHRETVAAAGYERSLWWALNARYEVDAWPDVGPRVGDVYRHVEEGDICRVTDANTRGSRGFLATDMHAGDFGAPTRSDLNRWWVRVARDVTDAAFRAMTCSCCAEDGGTARLMTPAKATVSAPPVGDTIRGAPAPWRAGTAGESAEAVFAADGSVVARGVPVRQARELILAAPSLAAENASLREKLRAVEPVLALDALRRGAVVGSWCARCEKPWVPDAEDDCSKCGHPAHPRDPNP